MNYLLKYSAVFLLLILYSSAGTAKELKNLYKIDKADKDVLNKVIQSGGLVERYIPGDFAEVLLSNQQIAQLETQGYKITLITNHSLFKNLAYALSDDHTIGSSYHNYEAVMYILDSLHTIYTNISKLISIGKTVEGRDMLAMCITDNPDVEEAEPEIKYIANMHGDELITQEMMLIFIEYLLQNYPSDSRIQQLIDNTEIWIMPNMNFDGSQNLQRRNANDVDLNRSFPDRDPTKDPDSLQIETLNMIKWSQNHNFIISANFHSGVLVVNYPWDYNRNGSLDYSATPDDETFIRLALAYAKENVDMFSSEYFTSGITNGAEWYEVTNGMMDWNYNFLSCMDLTIEISEDKMPPADSLFYFWNMNRESMLTLLEQINCGVHGIVQDSLSEIPLPAAVKVSEIGKTMYTDPDFGDYYRLLEPGKYQFLFESEGYYPTIINNVVVDSGFALRLNVKMKPVIYYTLSGSISDTISHEILSSVKIYFYQNEILKDSTITTPSGNYSKSLPVGIYRIITHKPDYFDKEFYIELSNDMKVDIQLLKVIKGNIIASVSLIDHATANGSILFCQMKSDTLWEKNYFEIDSLIPGNIKIFAAKLGYITTIIDTFLENGGSLELNEIPLWPGNNDYFIRFESGSSDFTGYGDWQLDNITSGPDEAYSGYFAWATNPHGNYSSGKRIHSLETGVFSLQGMVIPVMEIYHWYNIEADYDGANVKISDEYGKNWRILHPIPDYPVEALTNEFNNPMAGQPVYTGSSEVWNKISFNLLQFKKWPFVKFRFDLGVDEQKTAAGWYLDDFRIFDANATEIPSSSYLPVDKNLEVNIFPNPANPSTTFLINKDFIGDVDIIIFNINGQVIKKVSFNSAANQKIQWRWQGDNSINLMVASGIYFAKIVSSNKQIIKKIILIR